MNSHKLLLTGVFGPFGKKNAYGEALGMQMELLNNQITRQQGVHSPRQSYWTFALYLLAENISVRSTVLDFPSWKDFKEELKRNYSHVGINFIVPNVLKAQRMARYIRKYYPQTKIILGGYGTIIPDLKNIVPHDEACIGDGVTWLRDYFKEDVSAPISHPSLIGPAYEKIYGFSTKPSGGILMPGMGCENGCKFCITSHVFKKKYVSLLSSGEELFNACVTAEKKTGAKGFSIMDENFLKNPQRAIDLLALMEKHKKAYVFDIFSSADAIKKVGTDFLLRLGVRLLWIGVESKNYQHDKTKGTDFHQLIRELRDHGITVNASTILFQDHHNEETLREDIDYVISLQADTIQFMNYTPFPGTTLYNEYNEKGLLNDLHFRHHHGQGPLAFEHPYIKDRSKHVKYLRDAFRNNFIKNGPGIVNMAETAMKGYISEMEKHIHRTVDQQNWNSKQLLYEKDITRRDDFMILRLRKMQKIAMNMRPLLLSSYIFSPNKTSRKKVLKIMKLQKEYNGPLQFKDNIASVILLFTGLFESIKLLFNKLTGKEFITYQPKVKRVEYRETIDLEVLKKIDNFDKLFPIFITGAMRLRKISLNQLARRADISANFLKSILEGKIKENNDTIISSLLEALDYRLKMKSGF